MNVMEDMARQIGTDAYMPEVECEKTCEDCYHIHELRPAPDGMTITMVVPMPWRRTEGAIKAIDAIVRSCGFCDILGCMVALDNEACDEWEEA